MNIKQISEFETDLNTKQVEEDETILIKLNHNKKRIFIIGNYCSGTRWLNYLIIKNTPPNYLYALRNQHNYLDDNNSIQYNFKHATLNNRCLIQKHLFIIYIIRDFDTFLPSFLNNSYDKTIQNGMVGKTNMTVYEWYCHMIESNITLLRKSASNYIIATMELLQNDNGKILLNTLEKYGFEFIKPYEFIHKHTKTKSNITNQKYFNLSKIPKFDRNNNTIENIIKTIAKQPEIKVSYD
mgnify:CR=1 FL=1|jgi:hypothetical protein